MKMIQITKIIRTKVIKIAIKDMNLDIQCHHYKGEGYCYKINKYQQLWLCKKCEKKLHIEIIKQHKIEQDMKKLFSKTKGYGYR